MGWKLYICHMAPLVLMVLFNRIKYMEIVEISAEDIYEFNQHHVYRE